MYSTHSPQNDRTDTYLKYTDAKILKHRPYNPDLNLGDRFLFTRVQENCKRLKVFLRRLSEYTLKNELLLLLEQYEQVTSNRSEYCVRWYIPSTWSYLTTL